MQCGGSRSRYIATPRRRAQHQHRRRQSVVSVRTYRYVDLVSVSDFGFLHFGFDRILMAGCWLLAGEQHLF